MSVEPSPLTSKATARHRTGAFFDMDNTILSASSGRLYVRYLRDIGYVSWQKWIYISAQVASYLAGLDAVHRRNGRG